jgi:O-antigen ligase
MILYYLFLLLSPFQDNPRLGAQLFSLGFIPITPIKIVGLMLVVVAVLAPRPKDAVKPLGSVIPVLFVAWVAYPLFWTVTLHGYAPQGSLSAFTSYLGLLIATRFLITTRDRLRNAVRVAVLAETIGTLWLFKQFFIQHWARPIGPSSDPDYEALTLVMALPLSTWIAFYDDHPRWRIFGKVAAGMIAFSVILSQSRGGTLALGAVAILGWLRSRHKARAIAGLALLTALLIAIAPGKALKRVTDLGLSKNSSSGAQISTEARLDLLKAGLGMIRAHPLVGVGMDRFKSLSLTYNPGLIQAYIAHDTYLQLAAEGGIPSLLIFLAILALALRNFRFAEKTGKRADPALGQMGAAMRIALFGYMLAACFLTAQFIRMLWLCVFLSQSLREVITAKMAETETEARQPAALPAKGNRPKSAFRAAG